MGAFDPRASPVMASERSFEELPHGIFGAPSYSWCYYEPPSYLPPPVLGCQQAAAPNASGLESLDTGHIGALGPRYFGTPNGGHEHGDGRLNESAREHERSNEGGHEHGDGWITGFRLDAGLLESGVEGLNSPGK